MGKGDGVSAAGLKDGWGYPISVRDFTQGTYLGGGRPQDLYLRFMAGMDGTPMPSFEGSIQYLGKDDQERRQLIWGLIYYVKSLEIDQAKTRNSQPPQNGIVSATRTADSRKDTDFLNPNDPEWQKASTTSIAVSRLWQKEAFANSSIVQVRSLYNDDFVALQLEWNHVTQDRGADDGFPYLTSENKDKYKFSGRGHDTLEKISWDQVKDYIARAIVQIAKTYSGDEGKKRLLEQGYVPEMLEHWEGAGTRTLKIRGGMGLLGVIGKYGAYRFSNTLALVDSHVRKVDSRKAKGGRNWSNYTWHGDQAPGFPFVHGLQASDIDINDMRFSKLHISIGKNLVENKRADNHFAAEVIERGGKLVVISPEYSPSSSKADYWITIRPQTDAAFLLAVSKIIIDNKWYDEKFVKEFTDFPLLIRKDNLKRLKPEDIIPDYKGRLNEDGPSYHLFGLTKEQYEKLGDYTVYDAHSNSVKPVTRDDVGERLRRGSSRERNRSLYHLLGLQEHSPEGLRSGHCCRNHPQSKGSDPATGKRHCYNGSRFHSNRRRTQPLVPCDRNQSCLLSASSPDGQHR
jgi:hypothetical protein